MKIMFFKSPMYNSTRIAIRAVRFGPSVAHVNPWEHKLAVDKSSRVIALQNFLHKIQNSKNVLLATKILLRHVPALGTQSPCQSHFRLVHFSFSSPQYQSQINACKCSSSYRSFLAALHPNLVRVAELLASSTPFASKLSASQAGNPKLGAGEAAGSGALEACASAYTLEAQ
jgi:hypothetical protein